MAELIQKKLQGAVEKHQQLWEGLEQTQVREAEAGGTANRRSSYREEGAGLAAWIQRGL